ncbi:MAG: DMT family transporter, partial [Cyanobacteriota bacterium]
QHLAAADASLHLVAAAELWAVKSWEHVYATKKTILIKILSHTESSITITAYMGLFQVPLSLLVAVWFWQWPGWEDWLPLLAIGCLGTLGQVTMIHAFAYADVSTLLPFQFSALIWATLYGVFWFGEWPDLWTWVGGAIIFGSSLTLAYRESRLKGISSS